MSDLDRVKVGEFIKKGHKVRGVVHIGANDGYEVEWYLKLGLKPILCFEPGSAARSRFQFNYPKVACIPAALGNLNADAILNVTSGGGGGSTLFDDDSSVSSERCMVRRWAYYADEIQTELYNACVIDVQGMELDVLRGMDEHIKAFDFFVIECSAKPVYKGGAFGDEVVAYMNRMGYDSLSPMPVHDDILFIKHGLAPAEDIVSPAATRIPGNKLNCGSGNRRFDTKHGWINIDIDPKDSPDLVADWNNLTMFDDNSIELIANHHSIEHVGCGESAGFIQQAWRILKPGGSLIVAVPDLRKLARLWLSGDLSTQIYMTNVYGPFDGSEASRHKWGFDPDSLTEQLQILPWKYITEFNWRVIPGADIARDDRWILVLEAKK